MLGLLYFVVFKVQIFAAQFRAALTSYQNGVHMSSGFSDIFIRILLVQAAFRSARREAVMSKIQ